MTMLQILNVQDLNLWNNWEIRGMVLLSLLLQTILIIFGPLRKTIANVWIRILVWSAFLPADMVACVALAILARSQIDSSGDGSKKANNSIQAFWAPFLLLHLGGPDTITVYSFEDNELWLRHLLGVVVQVEVAFYVFSRYWGSGTLPFIAIPMFIVGIIKYSERTWVLWSSCSKSLRKNSSLSAFRSFYLSTRNPESDQQREYLHQAYTFFHISKFTMQDLTPSYWDLTLSHLRFSKIPVDGAFKVVEVELGLIYDMLYTKVPLIYSRYGIILRCISFGLSVTAFIIFHVKIDRHAYPSIDVAITYSLFVAAVFLEFYAFLCLVFSDRTLIWLVNNRLNAWATAIYYWVRKLTTKKRWSRSISQYNLISSSIENKHLKCLELVGIDEIMRQMHVNREDLNGGLQQFIFKHLLKKAEKMKENFNLFDKKLRSKIIGQRGDGVLEREGLLKNFEWCTTEVEFSRSIVVWHLATEICSGNEEDASNYVSRSKCLSEYMMYLLVIRPNMLSKGFIDEGSLPTFRSKRYENIIESYSEAHGYDDAEFQRQWKTDKYSLVNGGRMRAKQLLESISESKKRWEMIEEVWMEMLMYAAAHCPWKEHVHALRRGGELVTHVCFLMLHLGLSEQYEYKPNAKNGAMMLLDLLLTEERKLYLEENFMFPYNFQPKTKKARMHLRKNRDEATMLLQEEKSNYYSQAMDEYLPGIKTEEDLYYFLAMDTYLHGINRSTPDEEELQKARDKYLQVMANLSSSSLDKEDPQEATEKYVQVNTNFSRSSLDKVKQLEEIITHKDRELELFRASLTASTPQQGINSLLRSLPAQTDNQGTGQPPLKDNEISLCVD